MFESDKIRDVETDIYMSRKSNKEEQNYIEEFLYMLNEFDLAELRDTLDGLKTELNNKGAGVSYDFDKFFYLIDNLKEIAEEWKGE